MIAIKDMEMPKKCSECGFCINQKTNDYGSFGECSLQSRKEVNCLVWSRDSDCPLVEIVTCKDCKHNGTSRCKCSLCDGEVYMSYNHPDFYCADGERRE